MQRPVVTLLALALAGACLGGCSRDKPGIAPAVRESAAPAAAAPASAAAAASAVAPDPSIAAFASLMQAVFPNYDAVSGTALAQLPDSDNPAAKAWFEAKGIASKVMPGGETAFITSASPSDEKGADHASHAAQGSVSVYFLRQEGGKWSVLRRHENIAQLGSFGGFDVPEWVDLGPGKPGFIIRHGGTWFGQTILSLAIFDLGMPVMRDLAPSGIALYSGNGNCDEDYAECWEVDGKLSFVPGKSVAGYHDLVLDFEGYLAQAKEKGGSDAPKKSLPEPESKPLGQARYAYDGKAYILTEGENVVPGI